MSWNSMWLTSPFTKFPIRGPNIAAPISAEIPPTICITHEPAKSTNPSFASQPWLFHVHPASTGYTIILIIAEYKQYMLNLVLSAIAPDTIVAQVAQNTSWKKKFDQLNPSKSVNIPYSGLPIKPPIYELEFIIP